MWQKCDIPDETKFKAQGNRNQVTILKVHIGVQRKKAILHYNRCRHDKVSPKQFDLRNFVQTKRTK